MTIPVIPVSSMGTHATQDIKVDDDVEAEVKQDLSLASSIGSSNPVTVCDIRTLANNYQKMLMQATKEIKKLNSDLHRLQQDQAKLLEANVELALETKTLLLEQKKWKKDEQDLIHANEEFASEVLKLYLAEEGQVKERESLEKEMKELKESLKLEKSEQILRIVNLYQAEEEQMIFLGCGILIYMLLRASCEVSEPKDNFLEERLKLEKSVPILKHQEEKETLEIKLSQITESLNTAVQENEDEDELSCSHEYIRSSYKGDMAKLESTIKSLENALAKEKELREEGEAQSWELSQEIENSESDLKSLQAEYLDNLATIERKVIMLKEENDDNLTTLERKLIKLTKENAVLRFRMSSLKMRATSQTARKL